jgi:hypothetical protein
MQPATANLVQNIFVLFSQPTRSAKTKKNEDRDKMDTGQVLSASALLAAFIPSIAFPWNISTEEDKTLGLVHVPVSPRTTVVHVPPHRELELSCDGCVFVSDDGIGTRNTARFFTEVGVSEILHVQVEGGGGGGRTRTTVELRVRYIRKELRVLERAEFMRFTDALWSFKTGARAL